MPKKGYKMTDSHKENIRQGVKKHLPKTAFKKKQIPHNKGKKWFEWMNEEGQKKALENLKKEPWNKGKKGLQKCSKETKKKMSESHLERKERLGYINSPEARKKIGEAHKGEKNHNWGKFGKLNPNWKGGLSKIGQRFRTSPEYQKWHKEVIRRDNYICQKCGFFQDRRFLIVHHIESFHKNSELRLEVKNGIVLCEVCHKEFHDKYGRGNNTGEQLEEFLN